MADDELRTERERVVDQLDAALEEIRHGSLADGLDMVETVRDETRHRLDNQPTADESEDDEE